MSESSRPARIEQQLECLVNWCCIHVGSHPWSKRKAITHSWRSIPPSSVRCSPSLTRQFRVGAFVSLRLPPQRRVCTRSSNEIWLSDGEEQKWSMREGRGGRCCESWQVEVPCRGTRRWRSWAGKLRWCGSLWVRLISQRYRCWLSTPNHLCKANLKSPRTPINCSLI